VFQNSNHNLPGGQTTPRPCKSHVINMCSIRVQK